jgi:glucose/arabinose dehydrogenase
MMLLAPLLLALALAACGDSMTGPSGGGLFVPIDALPTGAQAVVTVTGPDGFRRALSATDSLQNLARGAYTIAAADLTVGGTRYGASPAEQSVSVADGLTARANRITYEIASARLAISVRGLPAGIGAAITVSGPGGLNRALTGAATLDLLAPGAYTISAAEVSAGGRTFRASPATQAVELTASRIPSAVEVWYGAGEGSLEVDVTGLPAGTRAAVTVTGPEGFVRALSASSTLRHLEPGTYTVSASTTGSDLTTHRPLGGAQTMEVGQGSTVRATVAYGGAPLELGLDRVAEGLTAPVFLAAPEGDARLFIVEREGRIRILRDGTLLSTPFLDIRDRVTFTGERGLFGMAFDPAYAVNGFFYVYYTDARSDLVLERFGSSPAGDVATGSQGIVITIPHGHGNHHGGMVAFGPDGMLYLAPGDGRCCGDPDNNAQNLSTLLGKMLRIDVRTAPYTVPGGNPYVGLGGPRPEIWAHGLRSPWRFSFDPPSAMLYIADVGENAREEINAMPANRPGLNYGWRLMEGTACFNPATNCDPTGSLTRPVHEYLHADGCSVIGGYVYRGAAIPELSGHYLYADFCRGWIRSFRLDAGRATSHRSWAGANVPRPVSFGVDGAGEMYVIGSGQVWRIVRR